jgi:integrase
VSPSEAAQPSARRWPPAETTIIDKRGLPVDVSGNEWRLNDHIRPTSLNWSNLKLPISDISDAMRLFIAFLIKNKRSATVSGAYSALQKLAKADACIAAAKEGGVLPYLAISQAKKLFGDADYQLHHVRAFYRWAHSQRFAPFCRNVLDKLEALVIGGNRKGHAVRSHDPKKGPLDQFEISSLMLALQAAREARAIPLEEQTALVLALATGSNPGQYASMREEDLVPLTKDGEITGWILRVPRHKKKGIYYRAAFRERRLSRWRGQIVSDLIAQNQKMAPVSIDDAARPLLRRFEPALNRGADAAEWAWHMSGAEFTYLLRAAVTRLGVLGRDGAPLRVTTRRFRYTKATQMVAAGASRVEVADALDHEGGTQNVDVYWDIHSDIVEHLDRALAMSLAPRAQAFAGLARSEIEAIRGDVKGSRRYFADKENNVFEGVGTCGSHSFCNITAPLACYTCVKFQAWMDGPHGQVLDFLLKARANREKLGLDPKIVAKEDQVIFAVANTIMRIEQIRLQEAAAND